MESRGWLNQKNVGSQIADVTRLCLAPIPKSCDMADEPLVEQSGIQTHKGLQDSKRAVISYSRI